MKAASLRQKRTTSLFSQKFPDFATGRTHGIFTLAAVTLTLLLVPAFHAGGQIIRKSKVTFLSSDSLTITADHYYSKKTYPYILLFHTENSSRGEYDSIAGRFARMHYNCLAVDLRSGSSFGYVENETAKMARENGFNTLLAHSARDVDAAIDYAFRISGREMVLLGSSSSASLCLLEGIDNPKVRALMAFSPGEFFRPEKDIGQVASQISKPVFVTGSSDETVYLQEMFAHTDAKYLNLFIPSGNVNQRGSELLTPQNPDRDQYWLAVLIFVKSL